MTLTRFGQMTDVATGSGLTEAREQEIRAWVADADEGWRLRYAYAEELLAEIDRLRAECEWREDERRSALIEVERLREAGNALADFTRQLDNALAICDSKAQKVNDHPDGEEWVGSYYLRCGPWHKVLGLRHNVADKLAAWRSLVAGTDSGASGTEREVEGDC